MALDSMEPTLGPDEGRYRAHFFAVDRAQAGSSFALCLALVALVFALEVTFFDRSSLVPIVTIRIGFFAFSVATYFAARRVTTPAALDNAALIWTLGFAAQFVILTAVRPPSRIDDVAMVMMVLAFYALAPTPLVKRAIPPVLLSIGFLLVLRFGREAELVTLWPSAVVLLGMNALGLWGSARLHTQRRRWYQSEADLRTSLQERDGLIDRLRQSRKMEAMGRIVGGVAHDFNNILGSMLASVEFLVEDLPHGSTSRADAETLKASVQRGAELTKQLLAFSRQQVLEPKIVNPNELVSDAQRMLMRTIGENIVITVSLGDQLPAVRVDPGQAQQILLNLAVNARDAMPAGGNLAIVTRSVVLAASAQMAHSVAPPGTYVVVTVSDDGTGMDAATLAQIFEPFFTTKPKGRGTGLGLSTVFGIVEQSGGHIRVSSSLGHGATFELFLPAVAERPAERPAEVEAAVPRGSETILLAEDDESLRSLMARVLTAQGYLVLQATDGLDALRVAQQHGRAVDLLTTDIVMPIMGGHDLATRMTEQQPGLKVLFMSGYTDDQFEGRPLEAGDTFLQKPVDPKLLARRVRHLLDA